MKTDAIFIFYRDKKTCSAQINVPGLGCVDIKECLSEETMDRVAVECEQALRGKLKIPMVPNPTPKHHALPHDLRCKSQGNGTAVDCNCYLSSWGRGATIKAEPTDKANKEEE